MNRDDNLYDQILHRAAVLRQRKISGADDDGRTRRAAQQAAAQQAAAQQQPPRQQRDPPAPATPALMVQQTHPENVPDDPGSYAWC